MKINKNDNIHKSLRNEMINIETFRHQPLAEKVRNENQIWRLSKDQYHVS